MKFTEADLLDQSGKTFVITGANTGVGYEAARALALKGGRVLMACRSRERAEAAIEKVKALQSTAQLEFVDLDLADLDSVQNAAERLEREEKVDVLINNAGVLLSELARTAQGFEGQMGINHLGHFALTTRLMPKVLHEGTRVVTVSSVAHRSGDINFEDINAEKSYSRSEGYPASKYANILFAFELARRLSRQETQACSVACHPGVARTEIGRNLHWALRILGLAVVGLIFNSQVQGAYPTLLAATWEGAKSGDYFGPNGFKEFVGDASYATADPRTQDLAKAEKLWDLSIELTGVDPGI